MCQGAAMLVLATYVLLLFVAEIVKYALVWFSAVQWTKMAVTVTQKKH